MRLETNVVNLAGSGIIKPHTLVKNESKEMCENGNKVQQGI